MKIKLLLSMSAAILLYSCGDTTAEPPQPLEKPSRASIATIVPDTSVTVTQAKALQVALGHFAPQQTSRGAEKEIKSVQTLLDSVGTPVMHIVNFADNQGFVIVSATKDYFPVLAESDHGNFDLSGLSPDHPVNLWLAEQKLKIAHADSFDPELKSSIASLWTGLDAETKQVIMQSRNGTPEKPQVYYDSLARWSNDPNITVYLFEDYMRTAEYAALDQQTKNEIQSMLLQCGNANYGTIESSSIVLRRQVDNSFHNKLLATTWSQWEPFNGCLPYYMPLGCTTIAAGQIINYHKFPATFNWSQIENTGFAYATQSFLYQLAKDIGVDFDNESGANIDQVKNCLEIYGYTVTKRDYEASAVYQEVSKGYPVYVRGSSGSAGHAWVCEGVDRLNVGFEIRVMTIDYRPTASIVPDLMVEAYKRFTLTYGRPLRFYYNWGWQDDNDGFYEDSDIRVTVDGREHNFNRGRKTLFIHPN